MSDEQKPWTWQQRKNLFLFLAEFPALTLMLFLRRRIGFRLVPVWRVVLLGGGLLLLCNPTVPENHQGPYYPVWLAYFGVGVLILGCHQHGQRWRDLKRGVKWHSYHRGISIFSWLPFIPEYNIRRFIDPFFCFGMGYLALRYVSPALGFYLIVAAICLRAIEDEVHKLSLERHLDVQDSMISSEIVDETVQHYEKSPAAQQEPRSGSVATGLSPELKDLMKRRKNKR